MELYNSEIDLITVNEKIEALRGEVSKSHHRAKSLIQWIIKWPLVQWAPSPGRQSRSGQDHICQDVLQKTIDSGFSRIQFTPDLMPAEYPGSYIFNPQLHQFEFKKDRCFQI